MKRLPNIALSDDELDFIIKHNVFDYGGEAIVCRNDNPHTLYKLFTHPETSDVFRMSENKLKKIIWLYKHQLDGLVIPTATMASPKPFKGGYIAPYIKK